MRLLLRYWIKIGYFKNISVAIGRSWRWWRHWSTWPEWTQSHISWKSSCMRCDDSTRIWLEIVCRQSVGASTLNWVGARRTQWTIWSSIDYVRTTLRSCVKSSGHVQAIKLSYASIGGIWHGKVMKIWIIRVICATVYIWLQCVEQDISTLALKAKNSFSSLTPSAGFKSEKISIKSISP